MTVKDKRGVILEALERVMKDRRFDEITVDEVAEEAGVGKGTVYRHFEDKENLFFEMVRSFLVEETAALKVVAGASLEPREKMITFGEEMSRQILLHGEFIRTMRKIGSASEGSRMSHDIMREHHTRLGGIIERMLCEAEGAGILRPGLDYKQVICVFKGMVMSRSMRLMHGGGDVPVAALVDMILEGIGRKRGTAD